jgi:hypothetical protein
VERRPDGRASENAKSSEIVVQVAWTVSVISLCTFIGTFSADPTTGTLGVIVVGGIGFFFGTAMAAFPEIALQLFGR